MLRLWRSAQDQIDALEVEFQIPRELVPRPATPAKEIDPAAVAAFDAPVRSLDTLVDRIAAENPRLPQRERTAADARRLTTRLLLVRQLLLGKAPLAELASALADAAITWRQLENRLVHAARTDRQALETLRQEVGAVLEASRKPLTGRH